MAGLREGRRCGIYRAMHGRGSIGPFLAVVLTVGVVTAAGQSVAVRPAAVPGQFYPSDPAKLRRAVEVLLAGAVAPQLDSVAVLVAPHAGLVYSGQIAADAYRQAAGSTFDTVVILGANHTTAEFRRASVDARRDWTTPLGRIQVDRQLGDALLAECQDCVADEAVHAREHSIEVQVPFVQVLWPAAKILPVVVGAPDRAMTTRVGEAVARVSAGRRVLVVASSDLSHYPRASVAREVDRRTLEAIARGDPADLERVVLRERGLHDGAGVETRACGIAPLMTALATARALGARRGQVVGYANSADVAVGDPARVVGYGAVVFGARGEAREGEDGSIPSAVPENGDATQASAREPTAVPPRPTAGASPTPEADRDAMLAFSRQVIQQFLESETLPTSRRLPAHLGERRQGLFVTLKQRGRLRGCIGRLQPDGPLPWVLGGVSLQSALQDPRFPPVTLAQMKDMEIEISLLTPLRKASSPFEIVPGRDGVALQKDGRSSVFLPQVAREEGWTREGLLDQLAVKAGLPPEAWRVGAQLFTFQAEVFSDRREKD